MYLSHIKENKFMLYVKNISERLLLSILVFLIMAISIKKIDGAKEFITKNIYTDNISLAKIKSLYDKYLGGIIPFDANNNSQMVFKDTLSYKITCYDKMLYSMKDYEHIEVNYPCKIKKFLTELCKKIGLEFKDSTFANQDREFANELFMTINEDGTYKSMGYTYRDVLDQIAETTGGCICMTLDDKVEVRYINETNDTIDEEYINDTNVNFGEKYRTN